MIPYKLNNNVIMVIMVIMVIRKSVILPLLLGRKSDHACVLGAEALLPMVIMVIKERSLLPLLPMLLSGLVILYELLLPLLPLLPNL